MPGDAGIWSGLEVPVITMRSQERQFQVLISAGKPTFREDEPGQPSIGIGSHMDFRHLVTGSGNDDRIILFGYAQDMAGWDSSVCGSPDQDRDCFRATQLIKRLNSARQWKCLCRLIGAKAFKEQFPPVLEPAKLCICDSVIGYSDRSRRSAACKGE